MFRVVLCGCCIIAVFLRNLSAQDTDLGLVTGVPVFRVLLMLGSNGIGPTVCLGSVLPNKMLQVDCVRGRP